jgi:site-specific recombinase XerD
LVPTHRRSTCGSYAVSLRNFYAWLDENKLDIAQLTHRDMTRWFQALHAERLAVITRHGMLMETRMYLRWLNERQPMRTAADELIRRSDFPKLPRYMPRPLTIEADRELQRRLAASEDPLAWALLLMRRTGLRIGELYNLEYHCARFDRRQPLLKVPLGKLHSERLVPLDPDAVELVGRLQSTGPRSRTWLVPGRNHSKCNWDELSDVLKVASRDLPDPARITSHRLRHTFATELLSGGMSLVGVMRFLGHQDIRMTLRYAAVTPEIVAEEYQNALDKLATKYRLPPTPAAPTPVRLPATFRTAVAEPAARAYAPVRPPAGPEARRSTASAPSRRRAGARAACRESPAVRLPPRAACSGAVGSRRYRAARRHRTESQAVDAGVGAA